MFDCKILFDRLFVNLIRSQQRVNNTFNSTICCKILILVILSELFVSVHNTLYEVNLPSKWFKRAPIFEILIGNFVAENETEN